MNSKIYRQADSRWGKLPYPTKNYTFAHNGCGCCSVTHCAIENPKYANYTPADVRKYMVQFATKGHGTLWDGITKGLQYYGYNVHWNKNDNMTTIFSVLAKSLKRGVILFGSTKGPDKTVWTTGGHYIAFVDYKIEGGKHWFYLKDSGGRHHDKWWCYEKSMKGDVRNVWICTSWKEAPAPTPSKPAKGTYTGTIPAPTIKNGTKGDKVANLQKFLNWYGGYGLKVDKICGKATVAALKKFQSAEGIGVDGVYGNQSYTKAKAYVYIAPTTPTTPKPTTPTTPTLKKPTGKYSGTIPNPTLKKGSKGTSVKNLQLFLTWYGIKVTADADFGVKTETALKTFQKTEGLKVDGIYGKASQAKAKTYKASSPAPTPTVGTNAQKLVAQMDRLAWKYGTAKSKYAYKTGAPTSACKTAMKKYGYDKKAEWSDCGDFVNTVVRESGIDKSFTSLHGVKKSFPKTEKAFNIVHSGKAIPSGLLRAGDIIRYKKTGDDQHAMFYYGNGRVCDAGHYNRFGNIRADEKRYSKSNVKKSTIQVLRVKE